MAVDGTVDLVRNVPTSNYDVINSIAGSKLAVGKKWACLKCEKNFVTCKTVVNVFT